MTYFDAHKNIGSEKRNRINNLAMCVIKNTQAENINDFNNLTTTHTCTPNGGEQVCSHLVDFRAKNP